MSLKKFKFRSKTSKISGFEALFPVTGMVSVDLVRFLHTRMVSVSNIFRGQTKIFLSSCQVVTPGSCCHDQATTELDNSETKRPK